MYKIIKTKIIASSVTGTIGVNPNIRVTMNYDDDTKVVSVKIDKIIRPDLSREEETPLTYETINERNFTEADFIRAGDNNNWFVDYDVINNIIIEPKQTSDFVIEQRKIDKNFTFGNLVETLAGRYTSDLLPLFTIKSFDDISGFDHSVLTFYYDDEYTVISSNADDLDTVSRREWIESNIVSDITYEVRNANDELVSESIYRANQEGVQSLSNTKSAWKLNLPIAELYNVRIKVTKPQFGETQNLYDVVVINGNSNKSRVYIGDGVADIVVNTSNLAVGDYTKIKLNLGLYNSFSELYITYI